MSTLVSLALSGCVSPTSTARFEADQAEDAVTEPPSDAAPILADAPPESRRLAVDLGADAVAARLEAALGASPVRRMAIIVDRPLYRPGETVWARAFDLAERTLGGDGAATEVVFQLLDPRGNAVATHRRPADAGASVASIDVPRGAAGGLYTLRVAAAERTSERPIVVAAFEEPRIRKELDLLREAYGPGDEVTAALTVSSAGSGPLAHHPVQVLVQVGGTALPRIDARTDDQGEATLSFRLPDDLKASDVVLTVLVEEGGWQESISRPVPVVLDAIGLQWFPEGGDLVTGLPSRVYLRARNAHGEPADVAGVIEDDRGAVVASFRTVHDGLGRLPLTPEGGRTYTARLTSPSSVAGQTSALPRAKGEGCVLRAFDDLQGALPELRVGVQCSATREVVVAGVHRDQVIETAVVRAGPRQPAVVHLATGDPAIDRAQGVARVTLFDEALEPLAERLIYRNRGRDLQIDVRPAETSYGPRDEVVLAVTTRDADGAPVEADLALSVVDDRVLKFADDEHGDLLTRLYLEPWLSEELDDPSWYLDPDEADAALGLDLVMGTFGWRRFARVPAVAIRDLDPATDVASATNEAPGQLDREVAENAGVLGALSGRAHEEALDGLFGEGDLRDAGAIGGLAGAGERIGAKGLQIGAGSLEALGSGIGGGGNAEGLGGLGIRGLGWGAPAHGVGGGDFGARVERPLVVARAREAIVLGSLDRSPIERVIRRHLNQVRYCYQRELNKDPKLAGKAVVKFVIASDGSVSRADISSSTLGNAAVESCLSRRFLRMQFPQTPGGGIVVVSYPFVFSREGGDARPGGWVPPAPSFATVREFPVPDYRDALRPEVRTDFRSTVMWAPQLRTGADGAAEVRFPLSDAVTAFRVTAEGVGGGLAGRSELELGSTLPFELDVPIPQQLSFGDRPLLPVRLSSRLDETLPVELTTRATGALRFDEASRRVALAPEGATTTRIPLIVRQGRSTSTVRLSASASGLSDAVERTIEVVPRGFPHTWSASGELEGRVAREVTLTDALPGSATAKLTVYPTALTNLLDGLEDMVRLPGGCFEQTSSSNYPNVLVLNNLDRTGRGASLRVDRTLALRTGYQRLTGYQVGSGGFETFGSGPGKEVLSAYGLLQFTDMKTVFPEVDPGMVRRDVDYLMASRDGEGGYRSTGRSSHDYGGAPASVNDAFITWALVETGHRDLGPELARQRVLASATDDPYRLALAALTLQHVDPAAGARATSRLAALQDDDGSFPGAETTVVGSRGQSRLVESTAMATLALLRAEARGAEVHRAARWLSAARSGYGWGSTQATVLALKALDGASAMAARRADQDGAVQVLVDGQPVGTVAWTGRETRPLTLDLAAFVGEGTHTLELLPRGTPIPFALEASWSLETPADHPAAPLTLTTTLASTTAELGEPVRLTATVANPGTEGVASPIARIGLPAGTRVDTWQLEAMKDRGEIAFFETRPREVTLYWEGFAAGERHEVALDVIGEVPGSFTAPPSSAYPYYDTERVVWSPGATLEVRI